MTAPAELAFQRSRSGRAAHRRERPSVWERVYCGWFPLIAAIVGVGLRSREYIYNRSLWPDEIAVVRDIVGRSFGQLMHTTSNGQAAPIGWFWAERLSTNVFGISEFSLRLVPFVASLLALGLFPYVAWKVAGRWVMPIAMLVFAMSPQIIFYSSDVKQYGSDITCALLIVAVTIAVLERSPAFGPAAWWAVTAACVIWFSQPGILVAAGCGVVLFLRWVRQRRGLLWVGVAAFLPLVVLLEDYLSALRQQSQSSLLQNYWVAGYPPKPFGVAKSARWLYHDVNALFADPGRLEHPALVLLLGAVGILVLVTQRSRRWTTPLVVLPIVLGVVFAFLRVYPLRQRLGLYLFPFIFILMCAGIPPLNKAVRPRVPLGGQRLVAVLVVAAVAATSWSGLWRGVSIFGRPLDVTSGRQSAAFIVKHIEPGDVIYIQDPWATEAWDWYGVRDRLPSPGEFSFVASAAGCNAVPGVSQLPVGERVWVYFDSRGSDTPIDAEAIFLSYFMSVGHLLLHYELSGATGGAYLFQITGSGPAPRPSWIPDGCLRLTGP